MRVNPFFIPILFVVALLGTVLVAQNAGAWSTSGRSVVSANQLTPADIKGWMTLQQVMDGIGIPQEELYPLIGIGSDVSANTALKDLESIVPGFEISVLRDKLTARAEASPIMTPSAPPATPTPAPVIAATPHTSPTPLPAGTVLTGNAVKGRMTLREVSDLCAVPLDALLQALQLPADTDPAVAIKDLVAQGKLAEVTDVQQAVTTLQSK
jgi:hypothetical protein